MSPRSSTRCCVTRDPARALEVAQRARATLAEWPRQHYGYRQRDVREILVVPRRGDLGSAGRVWHARPSTSRWSPARRTSRSSRSRNAVAARADRPGVPSGPAHRASLGARGALQTALVMLDEAGPIIPTADVVPLRRFAIGRIREEQFIDKRYGDWSRRLIDAANRGAARREGRRRPARPRPDSARRRTARTSAARRRAGAARLGAVRLEDARHLRLMRDRWEIRVSLYRDYQRTVGGQMLQLVKFAAGARSHSPA